MKKSFLSFLHAANQQKLLPAVFSQCLQEFWAACSPEMHRQAAQTAPQQIQRETVSVRHLPCRTERHRQADKPRKNYQRQSRTY